MRSTSADTTAPTPTALEIPSTGGPGRQSANSGFFWVAALDANEIDEVIIWFDRSINHSFGTGPNASFYSYPLTGLFGYGSDDWLTAMSQNILLSMGNVAGDVNITKIDVTDLYGKYQNIFRSWCAMGFDTPFGPGFRGGADPDDLCRRPARTRSPFAKARMSMSR